MPTKVMGNGAACQICIIRENYRREYYFLVEVSGVGPAPIPRSRLSAERLAKAIEQAVADPAIRQRAVDLGEKARAEDGVGEAVRIICQYMGVSPAAETTQHSHHKAPLKNNH